jgi:hypothetical protein
MADKKISALTGASTPLAGTEVLPIVQGGATVKVAVSDLTAGRAVSASTYNGLTIGNGASSGTNNVVIGPSAGSGLTTGSNNVIVGGYSGAAAPISGSGSGRIVFSNGAGTVLGSSTTSGEWSFGQNAGVLSGLNTTAVEAYAGSLGWAALVATSGDSTGAYTQLTWNRGAAGDNLFNAFYTEGTATLRGAITYNRAGGLTVYGTTSDQRLKKNIVDAGSALEKINSIRIRSFDWIETNTGNDFGVIAQELKAVAPECVVQGQDNEDGSIKTPWNVDTSALVPALIKSVQELNATIATMQAALKAAGVAGF